ncbi:MAG: hypothetical protein NTX88_08755, partial [Candidatus Atribacteria bacterium]|nr:hypothetical protein [Candidatus Atribacteria bacterium]
YHVPEGEIHYGNWKDIQETIKEKEKDPEWPKKVFEQARIRHSLICENHWDPESLNRNSFLSPLYEDLYLFHFDPSRDQSLIDLIQKENGQLPATAASFAEVVFAFFQSKADQGIRYFTSFISSAFSLLKASPEKIEATYQKQLLGHNLDPEEKNVLFTWLFYTYLEAMQQVKSPAQFVMGARWARPGMRYGESYVWTNHQLTLDLMSVFRDFPQVRMSLMFAALPLAHELTILARMLPNVSLLGFWWHTLFPTVIEQLIAERLESLPINKWIAIATDAYSVEWAYGKVSLVLQCLAKVLSKKMAEEYLTEQKALWIARKLLYENPQEIYGLSSTPENDG